jgi:hypothetical protein
MYSNIYVFIEVKMTYNNLQRREYFFLTEMHTKIKDHFLSDLVYNHVCSSDI